MGERIYVMTFQDGTQRSNAENALNRLGASVFDPNDYHLRTNQTPQDEIVLVFIASEPDGKRLFPSKHLRVLRCRRNAIDHGFTIPEHFSGIPEDVEAQVIILRDTSCKKPELREALKSAHHRDITTQKWKLAKKKSPSRVAHSGKYHRHQQRALC